MVETSNDEEFQPWATSYKADYIPKEIRRATSRLRPLPPIGQSNIFSPPPARPEEPPFGTEPFHSKRRISASNKMPFRYGVETPDAPQPIARAAVHPPWGIAQKNTVPLTLYYNASNPACASVAMLTQLLGLNVTLAEIDTFTEEHRSESFVSNVNPMATLPVINDEGIKVYNLAPILRYLIMRFSPENNPLYPEDPPTRAFCDQWLEYNSGTLYPLIQEFVSAVVGNFSSCEIYEKLNEALSKMNDHLKTSKFFLKNSFTIIDLAIISSVILLDKIKFGFQQFKALETWIQTLKGMRNFKEEFDYYYTLIN